METVNPTEQTPAELALHEAEHAFEVARERYERAERQLAEALEGVGQAKAKLDAIDEEAVRAAEEGRFAGGDLEAATAAHEAALRRERIFRAAAERPRREFEQAQQALVTARLAELHPRYRHFIEHALSAFDDARDRLDEARAVFAEAERLGVGKHITNLHAPFMTLFAANGPFAYVLSQLTPPEVRKRDGITVRVRRRFEWVWNEPLCPVNVGEIVTYPEHIARDLIASGAAERVVLDGEEPDAAPVEPERPPGLLRRIAGILVRGEPGREQRIPEVESVAEPSVQ